jgi:hypothetical protein
MCRLSWNLGASGFWNPQSLSRVVQQLLYLFTFTFRRIKILFTVPRRLWVPTQSPMQLILGYFVWLWNGLISKLTTYISSFIHIEICGAVPQRPPWFHIVKTKHRNDFTFILMLSAYFLNYAYRFCKCGPVLIFSVGVTRYWCFVLCFVWNLFTAIKQIVNIPFAAYILSSFFTSPLFFNMSYFTLNSYLSVVISVQPPSSTPLWVVSEFFTRRNRSVVCWIHCAGVILTKLAWFHKRIWKAVLGKVVHLSNREFVISHQQARPPFVQDGAIRGSNNKTCQSVMSMERQYCVLPQYICRMMKILYSKFSLSLIN